MSSPECVLFSFCWLFFPIINNYKPRLVIGGTHIQAYHSGIQLKRPDWKASEKWPGRIKMTFFRTLANCWFNQSLEQKYCVSHTAMFKFGWLFLYAIIVHNKQDKFIKKKLKLTSRTASWVQEKGNWNRQRVHHSKLTPLQDEMSHLSNSWLGQLFLTLKRYTCQHCE